MATDAHTPLDPYPDRLYGVSDSVGLGYVAGLHRLSPRERAVIALTDCAGFGTAEVAEILETSEGWVERTQRLARGALAAAGAAAEPATSPQGEPLVVERFQAALEDRDRAAIVGLLTEDVALSCTRRWAIYRGRERVARILTQRMDDEGLWLVATRANGQPAFGCYECGGGRPTGMLTMTLRRDRIATLTRFWSNEVMPYFGLPDALPTPGSPDRRAG
jgi:hypothetical protein